MLTTRATVGLLLAAMASAAPVGDKKAVGPLISKSGVPANCVTDPNAEYCKCIETNACNGEKYSIEARKACFCKCGDLDSCEQPDSRTMPGTLPDEAAVAAMNYIIDAAFQDVPAFDDIRFSPLPTVDPSWETCSRIDYSAAQCLEKEGKFICDTTNPDAQKQIIALGLGECFPETLGQVPAAGPGGNYPGSASCKAVLAFLDAMAKLTLGFPMGPAFANSEMVSWTSSSSTVAENVQQKFGPYESWRSGGVTFVDQTATRPPLGTWHDLGASWGTGNAVNGYAICEITTTVLQQTNNQAGTGTCGPSAIIAALNYDNPVKSLKFALELYWTGRNKALPAPTCEYIVENQPGLIPITKQCDQAKDGTYPDCPAYNNCVKAGGNPSDCDVLTQGKPLNPIGLQGMSTQAWQSNYFRSFDESSCDTKPLGMNWEHANLAAIHDAQASSPSLELYLCKYLLNDGKECKYGFNSKKVGDDLTADKANYWSTLPKLTGTDLGYLVACLKKEATVPGFDLKKCVEDAMAEDERINTFVNGVLADSLAVGDNKFNTVQAVFGSIQPSMTPELMDDACKYAGKAVLFIAGDYIQGAAQDIPPALLPDDNKMTPAQVARPGKDPTCNHWVLLESCNADGTYTIWTWGFKLLVSKAYALGNTTTEVPTGGIWCGVVHSE